MAFADHLTTGRRTGGVGHLIDSHLAAMDDDEATAARAILASAMSDRQVAEAFVAESFPVSAAAVCNWRSANKVGRFAS